MFQPLRSWLALRNEEYMEKTTYKFKKAIKVAYNHHPHLHLITAPPPPLRECRGR